MSVLRTLFTVVALAALVSADANLFRALLDNNKCLTVKGNVNKNGSPVVISDCSGTTGQLWAVVDVGNPADDNFQLQISPWNKCLDVTDGIDKNGQRPQIWECRTETIQTKFSTILGMISNPADNTFVWAVGNKCLDITDGKVTNGNAIQIWDCVSGDNNQQWRITDEIVAILPDKFDICLTGSPNSGHPVTVEACANGSVSQQWFLSDNAIEGVPSPISLAYPIPGSNPPQTNKLCLDVTDGSTMNGVHMQVWTCVAGNTNQKFIINNVTGSIMWAGHPKCLDLTNGSGANGNIVQMWDCTDNDENQLWNSI